MSTSELDSRNIAISMRKSVENLVISSQDAIGQSISQALNFSGVIANQTNQIIQDSKNLSRSPSPSLRNHEAPVDFIDNDKTSETSIQVPPYPALDTISVSSASDIAAGLPAAAKSEANADSRAQPAGARGGGADGARAKKKSWYNSLYPTYKSKSDDFKRLFKDLPDDERLIVDYSCALQKDILAHGRLYASQNYLCFYASIFGWETSLSLRWKDVTAITKEKTALVIPNAILVCTEGEKNFLTSFSGRDKAYLMLFRIWQNALMDSPMTSQEIWQWVHSCYGEELGFNSDDEGYACSRDLHTDTASTEELVDSMEAAGAGDEPTRQRDSSPPLMVLKAKPTKTMMWRRTLKDGNAYSMPLVLRMSMGDDDLLPLGGSSAVTNGDGESVSGAGGSAGAADSAGVGAEGDALPTDMSDSSDSEPDKPHHDGEGEKCNCPHNGRLFLNRQFPFNIDQLFTMLFTNSKFNLELLASRGATDYVQSPWQVSAGRKVRQASYRLALTSGPIGPKEVHITETQVMNKCSKSGYLYSIDASSENAGIPYADYFTVDAHYCLQRVSENVTEFSFYGHIKYKKTMWPMVKAFLEKNTLSGIEEYARQIESKVVAEGEGAAPAARKGRRRHRPIASSADSSVSRESRASISLSLAPRVAAGRPARSAPWLAGILALLLLINGLLYWRLYYGERRIDMDDLQTRMSAAHGAALAQWGALLERHTRRQRGELLAWRAALDGTIAHLAQTEQALRQLLETIKPSLEEAETPPPDADSGGGTPDTGGKSRDKLRDEM